MGNLQQDGIPNFDLGGAVLCGMSSQNNCGLGGELPYYSDISEDEMDFVCSSQQQQKEKEQQRR